ncbi:MAG: hypothetical protein H6713_35920 [Myxococcales bacterium]|nr:hypothetical protein [Myxococcales bacterium]MCB9755360.1 hypothetical protein [Myxococcales bacterium]
MPSTTDKRPHHPFALAGVLLGLLGVASALACNAHDPKPVELSIVTSTVGISIPIPPPSLTAEPQQDIDVFGAVEGDQDGARVILHEVRGDLEYSAEIVDGSFDFSGVAVDFTDNCFEVFIEVASDGELVSGEPLYFEARIAADDQSGELVARADDCATERESPPLHGDVVTPDVHGG